MLKKKVSRKIRKYFRIPTKKSPSKKKAEIYIFNRNVICVIKKDFLHGTKIVHSVKKLET
jgi:hypothetical protein